MFIAQSAASITCRVDVTEAGFSGAGEPCICIMSRWARSPLYPSGLLAALGVPHLPPTSPVSSFQVNSQICQNGIKKVQPW